MTHIEAFALQFVQVASVGNLVILIGAVLMGIAFGALPGLTATLGVALLTTLTHSLEMPLASGMMALLGVYVGAIYGGSHPAILLNIPGTAAGAATAVEGYQLHLQGRGGETIGVATVMSFFGTVVGVLAMVLFIPLLTRLTLWFQSTEYFLLALFGVLICGSLTSPDTPLKGWITGIGGMLLATVGMDPTHGYQRFTFGASALVGGIQPIPVILGGFAIPQIIRTLRQPATTKAVGRIVTRILPRWGELKQRWRVALRSGLLGVGVGAIPGVGEDIAAWLSYDVARKTSRHPEQYGKGAMEGVVAAETANNACIGGALIPLLTLGVPGSPPAMMLLGAILLYGIVPGPRLAVERPEFIPQMSAILLWASFAMLLCGFAVSKVSVWIVRMPVGVLMPLVALLTVIGSYAINLDLFDVYFMVAFGLVAYFMEEHGYPIAPLVIGIILAPMAEENLRRALIDHQGSLMPMFTRPIAVVFLLLIALSLTLQFLRRRPATPRQ